MLFKVKNLGLIDEAEIKLDGITVITGENNVGKSTIGKMLYCVNNIFLYDNIEKMKIYRIERTITNIFRETPFKRKIDELVQESDLVSSLVYGSCSLKNALEQILSYLEDEKKIALLEFQISKTLNDMSDEWILNEFLSIAKDTNFPNGTHNTYTDNKTTVIEISSDKMEQNIEITSTEDKTTIENLKNVIFQEAIYIESPHVVRDGDGKINMSHFFLNFDSRQRLLQLLTEESDADPFEKKDIALELKTILDKVSSCAPGNLVKKNSFSNKLEYEEDGRRFDLINVSNGVKTFAILKKLLVNAKLKRNGMLILDEPEIHLHPEWQLVFVEILVLLQKQFNLKILINTHSIYFLMAIEDYSKMHKITKNCNYYLIERKENHSSCRDCTDTLDEMYRHFAKSIDTLHNEVK